MLIISEKLLLTLWVGSMWTVGYIVAPVLFKMLDKSTAGNVAGQLFTIVSYLGLFCGIALLANLIYRIGFNAQHWQLWVLVVMLVIIAIGQFVLQPMMAELKAAGLTGAAVAQFGKLHGIASILFLLNSLGGLALVVSGFPTSD